MGKTNITRLAVLLGVVGFLALSAPQAHAALEIDYSTNGGATWNFLATGPSTGPTVYGGGVLGGITVGVTVSSSNSPGTAGLADQFGTNLSLSNSTGSTHAIWLSFAAQDFTAPTTPPDINFVSNIGGSVVTGSSANLLSYSSCVDTAKGLIACPGGSIVAGPVTPSVTFGDGTGHWSAGTQTKITSLTGTYSIGELVEITLGAGSEINFSSSSKLTPVPEPMSIALLGGVVLLTSRLIRRKQSHVS